VAGAADLKAEDAAKTSAAAAAAAEKGTTASVAGPRPGPARPGPASAAGPRPGPAGAAAAEQSSGCSSAAHIRCEARIRGLRTSTWTLQANRSRAVRMRYVVVL
jgi:hypothetical protein